MVRAFFFNGLIFLYDFFGQNLGLAIIGFTVAAKLLLAWPSAQFIRSQRKVQALQPKLKELQARYRGDREKLSRATMDLYRSNKVNPFSSCLPMLIQLPILYLLYGVFLSGLQTDPTTHLLQPDQLNQLYAPLREIYSQTPFETRFFPGFDLAQKGLNVWSLGLAALAAVLQFFQARMLTVKEPPRVPGAQDESLLAATSKQMTYLFPALTGFLVVTFPAGLGLYWVVSTIFSIIQQAFTLRAIRRAEAATTDASHPASIA